MSDVLVAIGKQAESLSGTANELIARFNNLRYFEEAAIWDSDAQAVVNLLEQYKDELGQFISRQEMNLKETKSSHSALPLHKRIFTSQKDIKIIEADIAEANKGIASVDTSIEYLYELIDRTPSSKQEQVELLRELRANKQELTIEKRELIQEMRDIRTKARQNTTSFAGFTGKGARFARAGIQRAKEAALRPGEDAKAAIERQLNTIEKKINWVSRFSGDDPQPQSIEDVLRCAYCGRRVEENSVCPGCGSDRTIRSQVP